MAVVTSWLGTLGLNGMLGLGAYWMVRHGLRQAPGWPRGLGAVVLAWVWATVGMELLGSFGLLALVPLLFWSSVGLALGFVLRQRDRSRPHDENSATDEGSWEWETVLALGFLLWAGMILWLKSLLLPVKVVSDGPIYHLYLAARWWKAGRIFLVATPFGENAATYFPAVGDLWYTWLMIGWGGDRLAKVGQAPFLPAAATAAYAIARRLGADRSPALLATIWFLATTPFIAFNFEPNVDTIFVAGYLIAAYFFLRFLLGDDGLPALALGALAAGGSLGTKAVGVVFVPALLLLALVAVVVRRRSITHPVVAFALVLLLPMVMAGYWYGRNLWLTGNPLYPLQVSAFGRVWLPGWYGSDAMRLSLFYFPRGDWRSLVDILLAVLDPRLAPVWVAAWAGAWAWGRPRQPGGRWVWGCAALALANVALYWIFIPYRSQPRFMFQALGMGVVPLALTFQRARWLRGVAAVLVVLHLLTAQNWPITEGGEPPLWDLNPLVPNSTPGVLELPPVPKGHPELWIPVALVGSGAVLTAWAWLQSSVPTRRRRVLAIGITLGWIGVSLFVAWPRASDPRRLFYPTVADYTQGWLDLESRSGPTGTGVAYSGTNLPYYLLGMGLRNEVRYVNVDAHRDWLLHDYHRAAQAQGAATWPNPRPGWDRMHPDYDAWLANLRAERIRLLFITRVNSDGGEHNLADAEGFPIEKQWADAHPEAFDPVYGVRDADPLVRIYRVHPPDLLKNPKIGRRKGG